MDMVDIWGWSVGLSSPMLMLRVKDYLVDGVMNSLRCDHPQWWWNVYGEWYAGMYFCK
jgi:hypothetical protein